MEDQLSQLIKQLGNKGLKETKEIAVQAESLKDFISYMEFDINERQQALRMAAAILADESAKQPPASAAVDALQEFRMMLIGFEVDITKSIASELERIGRAVDMKELEFIPFIEDVRDYVDRLRLDRHHEPVFDTSFNDIKEKYLSGFMSDEEIGHWQMIQLLRMLKKIGN